MNSSCGHSHVTCEVDNYGSAETPVVGSQIEAFQGPVSFRHCFLLWQGITRSPGPSRIETSAACLSLSKLFLWPFKASKKILRQ